MNALLNELLSFLSNNFPTGRSLLCFGLPGLLWSVVALSLSGWLKRTRAWKTGYTRKLFHFMIFTAAALIQSLWGLQALCSFGLAASIVIMTAVFLGDGTLLYEAMAREKDAPHRTLYILVPYAATLFGGIAANLFFGQAAIAGYLVTGFADAIAEPVGTRFGKHRYRVPA
jgi:phytol kinase